MKKMMFLLAFASVLIFSSNAAFGQMIKFGIGGGINTIQAPNGYTNSIESGGLGFSAGYHLGILAKLSVPLSPITPIGFVNYSRFKNSETLSFGDVSISQSIFTIGVGGELSVLPLPGPLSPYITADVDYNKFSDFSVTYPSGLQNPYTGGGMSRYGIGVGVGTEVNLIAIKFDVNAKYKIYNLIGKKNGEDNITAFEISAYLMF